MISLINYKEFGAEAAPSIKEYFEKNPYKNKRMIIDYLKNGSVTAVSPGFQTDYISGKPIKATTTLMDDGVYSWSSTLIYYVEKYNMRLPQEFEQYVLSKI